MDEVIEKVGNFGRFQAVLFLCTAFAQFLCVWSMMFMVFGNYNPGWSCSRSQYNVSSFHIVEQTTSRYTTSTDILKPTSFPAAGLNTDDLNKTKHPNVFNAIYRSNTTSLSIPERAGLSSGVCEKWRRCDEVVFEPDSTTTVTEWNLICDNGWVPALIITVQMCGVLVGSYLGGPIGDRFGRRVSLYSSVFLNGVANLASIFSTSWQMFAALRFFLGIAAGAILTSAFVYPMEFVGDWWRPVLGSFPTWSMGTVSFALVAFALKDWKNIHLASAVFSAICFLPVFWIPESMRWLAVREKTEVLKTVVQRIAAFNGKPPVNPDLVDRTIKDIVDAQKHTTKPGYFDLFRTSRLRNNSIKLGYIWVVMSLTYYTISFGIKAFSGNFYVNMILFALTEVPGMFLIAPLSNRFGRRVAAIFFFVISALCCLGIVVVSLAPGIDSGSMSVVLAIVSKLAITAAWGTIGVMGVELYPTVVRNLQSGYLNALSRLGAILASYIIPADTSSLFIAYATIGALLVGCVVAVLSLSESRGRSMADTLKDKRILGAAAEYNAEYDADWQDKEMIVFRGDG